MKIIIITSSLQRHAGHGRFSIDLIKYLRKKNIEVLVICHKTNNEFDDIRQLPILPPPLQFKKNYLAVWLYLIRAIRYRKELKNYNLIHCLVESYSFFTFLLSRLTNLKYFIQAHGTFGVFFFQYKIYGWLQKISYRKAHRVICVSNYTKNKILSHGEFDNLVVIPNGVDLELFKKSGSDNSVKENILIGVGTIKERKGFDLVIRALAIIKKKIPNIKYYIVGGECDSVYYGLLISLAEKEGVADNVIFLKNIADEELINLYRRSKIFVLTPISDDYNFEGFGLVYIEANAFGVPVVGSHNSGAEEAIKDGYNGLLVRPKDINDIAAKILILLSDKNLHELMSNNAQAWAKQLSWENVIDKYLKIFEASLI